MEESKVNDHISGFREEIGKVKESLDDFFTWFNRSGNTFEESIIRGSWDFSYHVISHIAKYIKNPEKLVALEIGYGGGRLIAAASRHFKNTIGIDVHGENELVGKELRKIGADNISLQICNGLDIPLPDASIDVVYSFIVFQHLEKIEIFERYFREVHRVLKPHGVAILYYGRGFRFSINRASKFRFFVDRYIYEPLALRVGYKEIPAAINSTNLKVSNAYAKKLARSIGYEVLASTVSKKKVPDGVDLFGAQNGIIIRKK